jgi:methionine-rich copper-binding protein CopC
VRLVAAAAAAVMMAAGATLTAGAHAALVAASPGPGEQVPEPVAQIVLTFDQPVLVPSQVQLITADFQPVTGVATAVDGVQLVAHINPALPAGDYTLLWSAVSGDGHTTSGSYQFGVRASAQPGPGWLIAGVGAVVIAWVVLVWKRRSPENITG